MKRIFLIIFFATVLISPRPSSALVADLLVDCNSGGCTALPATQLYSVAGDGYWYPGMELTKSIQITNSTSSPQQVALKANLTSPNSVIEDVIQITIYDSSLNTIYSGNLQDFYNQDQIILTNLAPSTQANFSLLASMATSAGNEYQQLSSEFDLTLGFVVADITPTPTPTSTSGGGGGGGGGSPGAPVCDKPAPPAPEIYTVEDPTTTSPLIRWYNITAPFTHYLIAYGPDRDTILYGNPNIGADNKYRVGSLTAGAQYCFYVRAVNDCAPGPISNIRCINVGSTIPAALITGFTPGVLGVEIELTPTPTGLPTGEVMGDTQGAVAGSTDLCNRYWLPLLFILAFIVNLIYCHRRPGLIVPVLVSLVAYLVDRFLLNQYCCLLPGWYCQFFWIGNIAAVIIPLIIYRRSQSL